jgi:uncharacterized SAM-binding protein YcdF (DUF218 family)
MFTLSKILWFVLEPSNFLLFAALAGLLMSATARFARAGSWLVLAAVALIGVFGLSPAATLLLRPLEERFPRFVDDGRPVTGIVMLGGGMTTSITLGRGVLALNEAGERFVAFADLARRYPEARLVFAGGSGALTGPVTAESDVFEKTAGELGIVRRITFERLSRNTRENAALSSMLVRPAKGERWLLVTSAWHMPRAMAEFSRAGWPVTAYPVDFRTSGGPDDLRPYGAVSLGLRRLDVGAKEWIGLTAMYLAGRSDRLLPAP